MTSGVLRIAAVMLLAANLAAAAAGCDRPGMGEPAGGSAREFIGASPQWSLTGIEIHASGYAASGGTSGNGTAASLPTPSPLPAKDGKASAAPSPSGRIAYLTFDDGPSVQTERILAILRKHGVKATFFVNGDDSDEAKTMYRRIAQEGHRLGNHTYSHDYKKLYRNADAFMEDVRKLERLLKETVGQEPDILRFPGGSNTRLGRRKGQAWLMPQLIKRVKAEGYQYFDWNVSSTDAAQAVQPKAAIVSSVLSLARNKEKIIVLMHDIAGKTTTTDALPEVIRGLRKLGFRFETLSKEAFTVQFLE